MKISDNSDAVRPSLGKVFLSQKVVMNLRLRTTGLEPLRVADTVSLYVISDSLNLRTGKRREPGLYIELDRK